MEDKLEEQKIEIEKLNDENRKISEGKKLITSLSNLNLKNNLKYRVKRRS